MFQTGAIFEQSNDAQKNLRKSIEEFSQVQNSRISMTVRLYYLLDLNLNV